MFPQFLGRQAGLRSTISDFLSERLNTKLQKLADNDPKRDELRTQFIPAVWLEDAARRVAQIQAITHSLKPIHPDAKGTSLFCEPVTLVSLAELGSHVLGVEFDADVAGNAAALDVYKFLKLEHDGRSLLSLATDADSDLGTAMSDDPGTARRWMSAFAGLSAARESLRSHALAKQLYWPVSNDPHDSSGYHLLAPLYPTSLVHRVYLTLREDRFGETAKAARDARKVSAWHDSPVHEYPQLAVQKLGGTKPQNISQLNFERRGDNCLLASLPPVWRSQAAQPLLGVATLFAVFQQRREVRTITAQLRRFLESDPAGTVDARQLRDELVNAVLDELIQFTAQVRELEPGWSDDTRCELSRAQVAWLDPLGLDAPVSDVENSLASDFANWLNAQLRARLPVGDAEYLHWRKLARDLFKELEREGANALA